MGILFIDSDKNNLENYKKIFSENGNNFVSGLNDALMLLESVFEFDLVISAYDLDDATGKDLHENFRMLPETEKTPIIFILKEEDTEKINLIKKMSLTSYLVSPDEETLKNKVHSSINNEEITKVVNTEDLFEQVKEENSLQNDIDSLLNKIDEPQEEQLDFDSLVKELNKEDNKTKQQEYLSDDSTNSIEELSKDKKFQGNIKTTPISDILKYIHENNLTVNITLRNEISEEECKIQIKNREIQNIEMEDFEIEDALFWVLNWDIANIEVSLIDDIDEKKCEIPIEEVIEEVINKRNEFDELSETLPDLDTILVPAKTYDAVMSDLEPEYKNIIELFDGTNTINDVISLVNEDNIYVLTIISQLYMDEILVLPEENNIKKEKLTDDTETQTETISETDTEKEDDDIDTLLSDYLMDEEELDINTEVLETEETYEELDKEAYINNLIESFKEEEEIIVKPKESPFKIALIILFLINIVLTSAIFIYKKPPQKIVINHINKQEKIIKKVELYNLGLDNKISYIKNKVDIVGKILEQKILKKKKQIYYQNLFKNKKLALKLKKADFYLLKGNYKKAIKLYKDILKITPNYHPILLKLATAYYNDNRNQEAKKIIEKLDFMKYDNINFIFLKAQVYHALNDLNNAYKYYNEFLSRTKDEKLKKEVKLIIKNIYKNTKIAGSLP